MTELKDVLQDWRDWDGAMYWLAIALGVIAPDADFPSGVKGIFWSDNPIGNFLYETLEGLVRIGVLERRDEPDIQYRWNSSFVSRK